MNKKKRGEKIYEIAREISWNWVMTSNESKMLLLLEAERILNGGSLPQHKETRFKIEEILHI